MLDADALPKKGGLSAADRAREADPEFAAARRRHPGVESAINGLEHRGLGRVRLRGAGPVRAGGRPLRPRRQHPPARADPARPRAAAAGTAQTRRLSGALPEIPAGRRAAGGGARAETPERRRRHGKTGLRSRIRSVPARNAPRRVPARPLRPTEIRPYSKKRKVLCQTLLRLETVVKIWVDHFWDNFPIKGIARKWRISRSTVRGCTPFSGAVSLFYGVERQPCSAFEDCKRTLTARHGAVSLRLSKNCERRVLRIQMRAAGSPRKMGCTDSEKAVWERR